MARPRSSLKRIIPGIAQGTHAATVEDDLGVQEVDTTLVGNSAGSINIILNSLLTSNVGWWVYGHKGYSYNVSVSEVTDPTRSAVFLSVAQQQASPGHATITANNTPAKVWLFQRGE